MNKICPKFILVTAGLPNKTKLKNIVLQRKQTILKRLLSWFIGRFNCKKKEETTSTSTILFPCLADLRASKMWKIGLDRRPFLLTIIISFLFEAALTLKSREEAKSTEEAYIGKLIKNSRYRWLKKFDWKCLGPVGAETRSTSLLETTASLLWRASWWIKLIACEHNFL